MYIYIACKKTLCICCVLLCIVNQLSLQLSIHTSDGWRHAFTYRWIKVYKPLFSNYICTYAYMYFCSDTRVFGVVSCMNLHSTIYQNTITYQTVSCMIRKKGNRQIRYLYVGAEFYNVMSLNKFKVEISSLPLRSQSDATLCSRCSICTIYNDVVCHM